MFQNFFIHTRSSIDRINRQLKVMRYLFSFSSSVLFILYYVYLIVIHLDSIPYLITYSVLLGVSVLLFFINLYFLLKKGKSRLEKRLNIERKRRWMLSLRIAKALIRIATISLAGYDLLTNGGSDLELISFILSILVFVVNIVINIIIEITLRDIDMLKLSFEMDIEQSKILSRLTSREEKEYSSKEEHIRNDIANAAQKFKERKEDIKKGISRLFK